ncbi:hypothetical protein EVAR_88382_1 [Eumeta japonica]|uniref:Uncharacterized protein n=1 Tax=Eumeta variegata TaxID=151549 RepID=A0A4C1XE04_EUMVA|nr:hypothetical protein EVAR_88382_1 [Eumeta japonica]
MRRRSLKRLPGGRDKADAAISIPNIWPYLRLAGRGAPAKTCVYLFACTFVVEIPADIRDDGHDEMERLEICDQTVGVARVVVIWSSILCSFLVFVVKDP